MNYTNFIFSIVMLSLLIIVTLLLFYKLNAFKVLQISIFLILLTFWIAQAVIANGVTDNFQANWKWPILVGVHRLAHAMSAVPIALWGKKIQSRKIPLITMGSLLAIVIFINFGVNQSVDSVNDWSVYLMMVVAGMFVATTGMQNLYWTENYNVKKVFASMALMTLPPALADCIDKVFVTYPTINQVEATRWVLLGSAIMVVLVILYFSFFVKENKNVIRMTNNDFEEDNKVTSIELKRVLFNSVGIFLAAISFELIRSTGVNKFFLINTTRSDDATMTSIIVSVITPLMAIFVSMFLIKRFKSYHLTIAAKIILVVSLLFGITVVSSDFLNLATWIIFLFWSSFGMSMYLAVTFGVMMHFHMHSKIIVLPIWLSIRIFGMFIGQIIGNEWMINAQNKEQALLYVFITSLIIALIGLGWTMLRYFRNEYLIYNMVDRYELKVPRKNVFINNKKP